MLFLDSYHNDKAKFVNCKDSKGNGLVLMVVVVNIIWQIYILLYIDKNKY